MSHLLRVLQSLLSGAKRGLFAFGRIVKEIFWGAYDQDVLGLAAQMAYSALFSLFPFLLLLNALLAYIPEGNQVGDWLLAGLRNVVSVDSRLYEIVQENVFFEVDALSATLLSVGVILTLWSASGAVMVLLKAIQRAYGLKEDRSWQRRRASAILWAIAGVFIIPVVVLLLVFGGMLGDFIGEETGTHSMMHILWIGLRWPVATMLLIGILGVFYRHGSSVQHRWYGVLPGSAFAVGAIIGVTQGLSWFLSQGVFEVRWLTYGVIGTVIVLLFWAFMIGLMVLLGAQINAAVSRRIEGRPAPGGYGGAYEGDSGQLVESSDDDTRHDTKT